MRQISCISVSLCSSVAVTMADGKIQWVVDRVRDKSLHTVVSAKQGIQLRLRPVHNATCVAHLSFLCMPVVQVAYW